MIEAAVKLKGNESFNIREGWLRKGIVAISDDPSAFTQPNAMDTLGVGSKMVKAIRFWLQATGLTQEVRGPGKRQQIVTEDFGEIIVNKDPYFEEINTLWLFHLKIVSNIRLCTAWNLFFNNIAFEQFNRSDLISNMNHLMVKFFGEGSFSEKLLADDCASILNMYCASETTSLDPEENMNSPFANLGLIQKNGSRNNAMYERVQPHPQKLDKLIVLYCILQILDEKKKSISVNDLLNISNGPGKVLQLRKQLLYDYLDALRNRGFLTINRTAGLDMVYVGDNVNKKAVLMSMYQ